MHLYSALLCIAVHPKHFTIMCGGGGGGVSPQPPPVCSIHLDDATAATGQRRQCAHHTPATGGEERELIYDKKHRFVKQQNRLFVNNWKQIIQHIQKLQIVTSALCITGQMQLDNTIHDLLFS